MSSRSTVNGLQVISDVHIEFPRTLPRIEPCARYLALCGDTGVLSTEGRPNFFSFLERCSASWERVFVISGNHEWYDCDVTEGSAWLRDLSTRLPNVQVLEKNSVDLENGYRILGTCLWSHIPDSQIPAVTSSLNDYHLIRVGGRVLTVADTNSWHTESVAWLGAEISRASADGRRAIVLTHHAPIPDANPKYSSDPINCAFETDLRHMMRNPPIVAWFWGHTHMSTRAVINGVLVQSNQLGYRYGQETGFDPSFVFPLV